MAVIKSLFGKSAEGKEISLYTLSNDQGMKAEITLSLIHISEPTRP